MNKPIKWSLLAVASLALLTAPVRAANVFAQVGDLILGFRATGGTGAGQNVEVNLGPVSSFYNAYNTPGASTTWTNFALPALSIQDLADAYGTNWYSRTDLYWGAAAAYSTSVSDPNGKPATTVWVSEPFESTPYKRQSTSNQSTPASAILVLYNGGLGSLMNSPQTTNSQYAAIVDKTLDGSWSDQEGSANSFGWYSPKIDGKVTQTLSLYELQPWDGANPKPNGNELGMLTLTPSGASFQAIPEPSTALLVALGLAPVLFRRKKVS